MSSVKSVSRKSTPSNEKHLLEEIEKLKREVVGMKNNNSASQEQRSEINSDTIVTLMNGLTQRLNLKRSGDRDPLRFIEFGDIKKIPYGTLIDIMQNNDNERYFKTGCFYILEEDVKNKMGYGDLNILTKDKIERVIDSTCSTETAIELYRKATDKQKSTIVDELISFIRDDKEVNQALVRLIEKESKIKIFEEAERAKTFMEEGTP